MGGKVAQGDFKANYQNNKLTIEAAPYKLDVEVHLGTSIKVAQGDFKANYQNNNLTIEAAPYKLDVEVHLGTSIKVEAFKAGQSMWTYETLREDKSTPAA